MTRTLPYDPENFNRSGSAGPAPLPSTVNDAPTGRRIGRAFRRWWRAQGHQGSLNYQAVYEHRHWWVIAHPKGCDESLTFDAVDAEGGDAHDGFSFEAIP